MTRKRFNDSRSESLLRDLKILKLSFAAVFVLLLLILPAITLQLSSSSRTLDNRSSAKESLGDSIRSWVVSPNGGEIVYGNIPIQFYAKSTSSSDAKFSFSVELYKENELYKSLFQIGAEETLANREGIYTKYVDFTGFNEGNKYKLKLITSDPAGENVVTDFSDNYFTISSNSSKPEFTSTPSISSVFIGDKYEYSVSVKSPESTKVIASILPPWLTFSNNKLSGKAMTEGTYSVSLVAVNDAGRQTPQVFSIAVKKRVSATPTVKTTIAHLPSLKTTIVPTVEIPHNENIALVFPSGDNLSLSDSKVSIDLPDHFQGKLKKLTVEASLDAKNWVSVYDGNNTEFTVDTLKLDGGEYYFRAKFEFNDGTEELMNYGPIHVIKSGVVEVLSLDQVKPVAGEKTLEKRPLISITFNNKSGKKIDLNGFKFELNGQDLTKDSNVRVSETSFSYVPPSELVSGYYKARVELGVEGEDKIIKEWTFQVEDAIDAAASTTTSTQSILVRKLIIAAITIIVAIFIISLWAIGVMRAEKRHLPDMADPGPYPVL